MPLRTLAIALCAVAAAVSLLAPWSPVYDSWAWLVWGREIVGLELDTSGGPSWKPLPALLAAGLAPFGGAAPDLWLLLVRAAWLAAALAAAALAARLAGGRRARRVAAGVVAAGGIVLLFDPFTPWLRQAAGGLSEPLLVAVALGGIELGLAGRHRLALALGAAAALIRPEAWPPLAAYAVWLWRSRPVLRPPLVAAGAAILALWFVPDLLGSGDPLTGAERARRDSGNSLADAATALVRGAEMPLAGLWAGAVACVVGAARARERPTLLLAAAATAWFATVALLALGGYAGLPRFTAPAAAAVCVLGAVGLVRLAGAALERRRPVALAGTVAIVALLLAQAMPRAAELGDDAAAATRRSQVQSELFALAGAIGERRLAGCAPLAVSRIEDQTALAWRLELPLAAVRFSSARPERGAYFEYSGAREPGWVAYCDGSRIWPR